MEVVFLKLLNRSIAAGWLILAVICLRPVLRRAPRWMLCLLWGLVAVRLLCPVSLQSVFSLIPSRATVRQEAVFSEAFSETPVVQSGIRLVDHAVNPVLRESLAPGPGDSVNPLQVWLFAAGVLWAMGVVTLLGYAAASYVRLRLRLRTALGLDGPVYLSEFVDTPFILGVLRPRIYLPAGMPEALRGPVLAHEKAHLERRDHLWKLLAYLLLAVYWFHPLCWAAYCLFSRDVELACDEKVIKNYDGVQKRAYSEALLECSVGGRRGRSCPLAFGEVGVKARIRSVMKYKKPAFWIILAAAAACLLAGVCFLTDPVRRAETDENAGGISTGSGEQEKSGQKDGNGGISDESGSEIPESGSGDGENGSVPGQETPEETPLEAFIGEWTRAFVGRDADRIADLCGEEMLPFLSLPESASMPEGVWEQAGFRGLLRQENGRYGFGESKAWPRDPEEDVVIRTMEENRAEIIYYAWTEEPRVIVWKEVLSYELREGQYAATSEELIFYDNISSEGDFAEAYDIYADLACYHMAVDGGRMDYSGNGAGEELERRAVLSSSMEYRPLFEDPKQAAIMLLNLSEDEELVEVKVLEQYRYGAASRLGLDEYMGELDGIAALSIAFPREDGVPVRVGMVQYGSSGIWIPVDYSPDPFKRLLDMNWDQVRARNLSVDDDPDWQDIVCISEIPKEEIRLYGYNDEECGYRGVAIEIGDDVNYFDWTYTSPRCILPEIYWNGQKNQLQAALNIYTGTGADAWELHILQRLLTGTLEDYVLDLNGYKKLLEQRIGYSFDGDTGRLTLYDNKSGETLTSAEVSGDREAVGLELGDISHFNLGEAITLQVQVGYCREGTSMGEYEYVNEEIPVLEADLILNWEDSGSLSFDLGEVRVLR